MSPSVLFFAFTLFFFSYVSCNNRPVIGVIAQPTTSDVIHGQQYIAASYVKWIESAGARVVPITYGLPLPELKTLFLSLNGLMLPGGGDYFSTSSPFWTTLQNLWQWAIEANEAGDYFPIHGTCFGFQLLGMLAANGDTSILSPFDSENYTVPLTFTTNASTSRYFSITSTEAQPFLTSRILNILGTKNVTMNNHHYGISPSTFSNNSDLKSFFTVLSTNVDREGLEFISTMEGTKHPIYATQWHPEKPLFEWDPYEVIDHVTDSIAANQYPANFFVKESRKSNHQFVNQNDLITKYLIYNFPVTYNYLQDPEFEQVYFFKSPMA